MSEEELKTYKDIDFNIEDFRKDLNAAKLTEDNKADLLMRRWRFPTLSFHGIQVLNFRRGLINLLVNFSAWVNRSSSGSIR